MQVVLGVSMTPTAVRMVLVEGVDGDGVTRDSDVVAIPTGEAGLSGGPEQVVAAILGTRQSAEEGAHQLAAVGVAWTDHTDGARLRRALREHEIDDVIMVSELHAASALAQAVGRRVGYERTALLFVEGSDVTLAVVRTVDGAVVAVQSRALHAEDVVADLRDMVTVLERTAEPPQAVFLLGADLDVAVLAARIAEGTTLPVHAPDDADLALARGAALAAAATPRFEAETVVVAAGGSGPTGAVECGPSEDTAAGPTQLAAADYMTPLGYSAVADDEDAADDGDDMPDGWSEHPGPDADADSDEKPFLLVGSTLATIFVVGVVALVVSLAVTIRPAAEQRPGEMRTPPAPTAAGVSTDRESSTLETIEAPVPVVREAPRTAFVPVPAVGRQYAPAPVAPAAPQAPGLPAAAVPAPAVSAPIPQAAPAPVAAAPIAPAPAIPPIVVAPVIPILPPFVQSPIRIPTLPVTLAPAPTPTTAAPSTVPSTTTNVSTPNATTPTSTAAPSTTDSSPTVSVEAPSPTVSVEAPSQTVSVEVPPPTVSVEIPIPTISSSGSGAADLGSGE